MNRAASPRRVVTWSAIVGYGLVVSGLPLPVGVEPTVSSEAAGRLAGKDRSTPFPCMDKPCGCATAAQCFTNCCCHTPAETLAWARARGVDPGVIASLQRRVTATPGWDETSCCVVQPTDQDSSCDLACRTPHASASNAPGKNCCDTRAASPLADGPADSVDEPAAGSRISLRAMLACGGIAAEWLACGASLPPPPVVAMNGSDLIDSLSFVDESASSFPSAPEAPPPRVA